MCGVSMWQTKIWVLFVSLSCECLLCGTQLQNRSHINYKLMCDRLSHIRLMCDSYLSRCENYCVVGAQTCQGHGFAHNNSTNTYGTILDVWIPFGGAKK